MPELKNLTTIDFVPEKVDLKSIPYKDKVKEKQRQQKQQRLKMEREK